MHNTPFNPDFQNQNTGTKIVVALERISEAFRVLLWNESKARKLSPIQIQLLIFLKFHPLEQRKVSYLAREFNMAKPTISDTVKLLEQKEFIRKEYLADDKRSFYIQLTEQGDEIAQQTSRFAGELIKPIHNLTHTEQEKLLYHLIEIIHHLNAAGIITLQRMCFTCSNFRKHHNGADHYCVLLNKALSISELRIDCPEHESIA